MSRPGVLELRGGGGKDTVLVVPAALLAEPSSVQLPEPPPQPGLLLPDGSINWSCPCLGGMAAGPCGSQFRDAFSCFHYSEAEPKGSECFEKFSVMQQCMSNFPELYGRDEEEDAAAGDDDDGEEAGAGGDQPRGGQAADAVASGDAKT